MSAVPPTIVSASAGSGKTHRLTQEVVRSVISATTDRVRIEGLVAVTYTRKAHAELAGRLRRSLIEHGAYDQAARMPLAFVGTVHAVCLRFLQELALDAGLSPYIEVLADDGGRRLRAAADSALDPGFVAAMDRLARRLEISWDARIRRYDWIRHTAEIMEVVRGNRLSPDALVAMGRRSVDGLLALLPPALPSAEELDRSFATELEGAVSALDQTDDRTQKTATTQRMLRDIRDKLAIGELAWSDWVRAAKSAPAVASQSAVAALQEVASAYQRHPRLHADIRDFTTGLFESVRIALSAYADWKARRRLVDYVDMTDRAVALLDDPRLAAELSGRLDLVVVDELQDTSPIQLALFMRLHQLAGRSVWVGDGKQCIFEYAGADPVLMEAVVAWATEHGAAAERLGSNHRSRPELVAACSELFVQAFAPHGWSAETVRIAPVRVTPPGLAETPPLGVWWLDSKSLREDAGGIAEGVRRLLEAPHRTPVVDAQTGEVRSLRARDLGILVSTNDMASGVASALHRAGVRVAVARDGLLATPEGTLLDAALRWLVAPHDRLSRAILEALGGWNDLGADGWLAHAIEVGDTAEVPAWLRPLEGLRRDATTLTPAEVLDRTIHLLDAASLCARWPDPQQRLGNLEALRALAARYEERCTGLREAATLAGLVRYFDQARRVLLVHDEERASDEQFRPTDDDAVTVCTYHRAKGLEWPVVVLASLDRAERRDAFDVCPESTGAAFDPANPLGGRWVRFWPWPFGQQRALPLADTAAGSAEGLRVSEREKRERVRLLYVGFTRARDHLVMAVRMTRKGPEARWLEELRGPGTAPLLSLPTQARDGERDAVRIARSDGTELSVSCRVARLGRSQSAPMARPAPRRLARPAMAASPRPPFRIAPSSLADSLADRAFALDRRVGRVDRVSAGVPLLRAAVDWEALGTVVHAFFAADPFGAESGLRHEIARRLVEHGAMIGTVEPDALVAASDSMRQTITARWPGASWSREVPVTAFIDAGTGRRRIQGVIDLLLETSEGLIVIDHKIYPAPSLAAVRARAMASAPQLAAYAHALRRLGRPVSACYLHFPVAGVWAELAGPDGGGR